MAKKQEFIVNKENVDKLFEAGKFDKLPADKQEEVLTFLDVFDESFENTAQRNEAFIEYYEANPVQPEIGGNNASATEPTEPVVVTENTATTNAETVKTHKTTKKSGKIKVKVKQRTFVNGEIPRVNQIIEIESDSFDGTYFEKIEE